MNGGALLTGAVAALGGVAWLRVLGRAIAIRVDEAGADRDEPAEYEGPFRHFSTGYLEVQRVVAGAIVGAGVVLVVVALFA